MTDNSKVKEREEMAQKILKDAPKLKKDDEFNFACQPGIACFNKCCRDVNIVLTPLDILRMARRLEMTTTDFLTKYTFVPFSEEQKLPFVFLKMDEENEKRCYFVADEGCQVYEDRPWPCRMYPVGQASPSGDTGDEEFFFMMQEDHCKGHEESKVWTIQGWMDDQGVEEYEEMGKLFREILLHPYLSARPLDPPHMEMFYMASYDLDKFRQFVTKDKFLKRFRIDPELVEKLRSDDMEMMRFAFRWLRFALFGEMTIELNEDLLSEREKDMVKNKIKR